MNQPATTNTLALQRDSADYPGALRDLHDAPRELWARGTLATLGAPVVAIVGTRNATPYGLRVARALALACARAGVCVVSGLARGVDGAAHQAALDVNGRTAAVLGTGVDVVFPRSHRALQQRVANEGLLLSELPPGSTGHPGAFPRRNRIIAALASITVVVEAPARSGALITSAIARELGRQVAVVPGNIDVSSCAGSNELLRLPEVAAILSADDLLAMLEIDPSPPAVPALDGDAAECWHALQHGSTSVAALASRAKLTPRRTAAAVSALELEGLVRIDPTGQIHIALDA